MVFSMAMETFIKPNLKKGNVLANPKNVIKKSVLNRSSLKATS